MYRNKLWKSIFNALYLSIFIGFLRNVWLTVFPSPERGEYPQYLILAMFSDKGMLLGYTDELSVAKSYRSNSSWGITIAKWTPAGYRDLEGHMSSIRRRLVSVASENNGRSSADLALAGMYGFNRAKIDWLAWKFNNTVYL